MKNSRKSETGVERRILAGSLELRAAPAGDGPVTIRGYAARYDEPSEVLFGVFREVIQRGAFDEALASPAFDAVVLFNHNQDMPLGRVSAGTARFWSDDRGLAYEAELPDTSYARDLIVSMERGDVFQSSFGFTMQDDGDEWSAPDGDGIRTRTIKPNGVRELIDGSPVVRPAYPSTSATVRSKLEEFSGAVPDDEPSRSIARENRRRMLELIETELLILGGVK